MHCMCRASAISFVIVAASVPSATPGPGDVTISDISTMMCLIVRIQPFIDRPLTDATGFMGAFAWSVSFATRPESTTAPAIYTALQEQLGLKAERRTAPFDVVVIDSVEMPTPN